MTSITSSTSAMLSPLDRLQAALQTSVTNGKVKSADQGALSSAITDIDTAMRTGGKPAIGTDPSAMKDKVSSLIDQEVSDGKLTTDQATELKQVFAQATPQAQAHGHHHGGHGHGGGVDNLLSSLTGITSSTGTSSISSASTPTSTASSSPIDQLVSMLKQLNQTIAGNTTYNASSTANANGSSNTSSGNLVAMLVNGMA